MSARRIAFIVGFLLAVHVPVLAQTGPIAGLIALPFEGEAPLTVSFDGSPSSTPGGTTIDIWHWEFGDGDESFDAVTTEHTYTTVGNYRITLTITNSAAESDSISGTIYVTGAGSIFAWEPIPSPTPLPTATPLMIATQELPTGNIISSLATTEANLSSLPANLSQSGQPLLPQDNSYMVFRYAKWILSANIAEELFGPFAPIIYFISIVIQLLLIIGLVYFIIFVIVLLIRFAVWIVSQVLKFIPFFG